LLPFLLAPWRASFSLPFGLMDSVLSESALALLVITRYRNEKIIE
jgi:hypothetical protein